jgi:hypothetical protein
MEEYWIIGEYCGGLFRIRTSGTCEWEVLLPGQKRVKGKANSYRVAKNMALGVIEGLVK